MTTCDCHCHSLASQQADGTVAVDVYDPVASIFSCAECEWKHSRWYQDEPPGRSLPEPPRSAEDGDVE